VGIVVEYVPLPIAYTAFDFGVNFTIFSGGIEVAFDYRTALFSAETVSQWFGEFEELLKRVTADPNLSLSDWTKGQPLTAQSGETGAELSYVAPRTQVEQTVAAIWEEVLGRDRISIFSDFFELGGHSLLATQMVARMRDIFGVDISVEDLFQQPSIVGVAGIMEKLLRKRERRPQESIQNCSHERPLPVSFAQRRLWLIHELDPSSAAYNVTGALRLLGILDYAALESALDSLIKRHESLRTVFLKGDGEPVQQVLPHKPFQLERVDIAGPVPIEERSSVLVARGQEAARHSFDLAHGPLFRAQLFKFNEDDHVLIITIHHIVCDGWSGAIILKEIGIFYDAFCSKKPVDLAPLSIQFADYAVWQRNWLQGETLQGQLDYWVQHLTGAPQFLKLPTAHPRNAVPSLRGTHEAFHLEEALSLAVAQFCRREGVTPFMTLLAAFSLLLALHSGQDDLIVGTDIANRDRVEAEDLVGHFVNLLPLRLKPADQLTFREYVRQVRKVTLGAYRHQDVPFDLLVRALRPERKMTNTPLVQVLFVLHNFAPPSVISEKVRMEQVPLPMETSEFELILSIQEERGKFIGTVGYSTDLYQRAWICSLISQLQDLLRSAIGASDSLISSLVHARSLHPHELSEAKSLRADVSIS
jgi:acyl carrier protein